MTTMVRDNLGRQRRTDGRAPQDRHQQQHNEAAPERPPRRTGTGETTQPHRAITEESWGPEAGPEDTGHDATAQQHDRGEETRDTAANKEAQHRKHILNQIALGALGKAARTLFSSQLPRARASEVGEQLRDLHPQEDPAGYPRPPQIVYPYDLKPEKVKKVIVQRLGRASAPGLDGWTRELLIPVAENKALLQELTALVQDILVGNVGSSFATRIRACVVHLFLKEAGSNKVRPITPESGFLNIASHIALSSVEPSLREVVRGWQFGVWGDSTEAVKRIREAYANDGADTLVALDAANAYNRMSRKHILEAAYAQNELRFAFGTVNLSLGAAGELALYEDGLKVQALKSTEGVRQGMVLGPLLFANVMAEVLRPLLPKHPGAKVIAYLDDLTVVGPQNAIQAFLDEAGPLLSKISFDLNPAKSHHLTKSVVAPPVLLAGVPVPVATGVVRILGAGFLASGAPVYDWLWEKVGQYASYFAALEDESLPRLARLTLLRVSALPRLTFLLRTHSPQECRQGAEWFDARALRVLSVLLGGAVLDETAVLIARLPLSMGGLGLRSQKSIAEFASACVGRKTAQGEQTRGVDSEIRKTLSPLLSEPCLALLEANAASGATRALVDPAARMTDAAAEVMLKHRLHYRVLPGGWQCVCGADATNDHINTCRHAEGGARIARHNGIRDALIGWAAELGYAARAEPAIQHPTATAILNAHRRRLDVEIVTPTGVFVTDVTVTYPGRTGLGTFPLHEAHTNKIAKHGDDAHAINKTFVSLALKSTGGIHKKGFQWLRKLAGAKQHPYTPNTALSMLLTKIAQALHEGNAYMFHVAGMAYKTRQLGQSVGPLQG